MQIHEANVDLKVPTALRVRMLKNPWLLPILAVRLGVAWVRLWIRARKSPRPDVVLVGYMGHLDIHLARYLYRDTPIVLDHLISAADTATDRRAASRLLRRALTVLDRAALGKADLILVDTEEHLQSIPEEAIDRAVVVPVGTTQSSFRRPPEPIEPFDVLEVVFVGSYTPLQGAPTIGEAVARMAHEGLPIRVTMAGRGQDLEATRGKAGAADLVRWTDWVETSQLPELLARHHVCLGIFGTGPKALRVVPNKVYQGAAAGCAVVTSDTPPQRRALGDDGVFVEPGNPDALAEALIRLAGDPTRVDELRRSTYARARAMFSPEKCVEPLREALVSLQEQYRPIQGGSNTLNTAEPDSS